ncbi:MAG: hypothetical protein [Circular genetic element sp.]|nr:MAG: hypothetical protein [Circular genetic element sp.]
MGTTKTAFTGARRMSVWERRAVKYDALAELLRDQFSNLFGVITDDDHDFLGLNIIPSDRGGFLGILKRQAPQGQEAVLFASGEDYFEVLVTLNAYANSEKWKYQDPYNRESAKAAKKKK